MTHATFFALISMGLFLLGLYALISYPQVLRKILALNIMGSGVFLFLVTMAARNPQALDHVSHAMVLIGIVMTVSLTALALALARRIHRITGKTCLPEENSEVMS